MLANMRGMLLMNAKDGPGAIKSFGDAVRLAPQEPEYVMNLARAKLITGDPKGALATMDEFLAGNPKSVVALQLAAALALQGHEVEKAAGYVERLRQTAPERYGSPEGDLAMAQKRRTPEVVSEGGRKTGQRPGVGRIQRRQTSGAASPERASRRVAAPRDSKAVVIVAESKRAAGKRMQRRDQPDAALPNRRRMR